MSDKKPLTRDDKEVKAGDTVYHAFARHENPINVCFILKSGLVAEAFGHLVVVSTEFGNWGVTPYLGNWFSTVEAAKLDALADAENTFTKFRAAVVAAKP